ncbi:MAG: cytochrome c oxidase accessory protein CcoG [Candidatus Schekmanbacteria bacterium]|nr:cytochrome c oxidase accessory protein CcoG [Candidatus Schekmanbacteria bacterium]
MPLQAALNAHREDHPPLLPAPVGGGTGADGRRIQAGAQSSDEGRALSTLNRDGSRRWLNPRPSSGIFSRYRRAVAWALIAIFTALPHLTIRGRPILLLDLPHRQFTILGVTFLPTDTVLLMLLGLSLLIGIFAVTALFGRIWCGWACPQTVYMELLFRPLERLIAGTPAQQRSQTAAERRLRSLVKYGVYLACCLFLAHTFLAYFVPPAELLQWVTSSPRDHPAGFAVVMITTALMMIDFALFREQMCLVACPYGRFQSVLLDRQSLIVGYDFARGEPRSKPGRRSPGQQEPAGGDCVDCRACVLTCPTGIDIRDGLQMECIHCTQCIDACDAIMLKMGRPRGLIRYSSKAELDGSPRRFVRPRLVAYCVLLLLLSGVFAAALAERGRADVTVLRGIGGPFTATGDGQVANQIRVKITNRTAADRTYRIALPDADGRDTVIIPENPLTIQSFKTREATVFILSPHDAFPGGRREARFRVDDEDGVVAEPAYRLLGPAGAPGQAGRAAP